MSFLDKTIAIDTEYHTNAINLIDNVYCLSASTADGRAHTWWVSGETNHPDILDEVQAFFGIDNPIWLCHAYDLAERRALRFLHAPTPVVLDTYILARLMQNSTSLEAKSSASYACLCKLILGVDVDEAHKEAMRELCIQGTVEGHEDEIMRYCESDTTYLHPLAEKLVTAYDSAMRSSLWISHAPKHNALETALNLCRSIVEFGIISDRGLPISVERFRAIRKGAVAMIDKIKKEFADKYPGVFYRPVKLKNLSNWQADFTLPELEFEVEGSEWRQSRDKTQEHFYMFLKSRGLLDKWERTASGFLSMKSDLLKDHFKGDLDGFGVDYYKLSKKLSSLKGVGKKDFNDSWLKYADEETSKIYYQTLNPIIGTQTGRCAPKTSQGFVFGWAKMLYCILDPPHGKWLVELDFGSEEVFIQAALYGDPAYNAAYHSKDYYLWLCWKMGKVSNEDWETLSASELKKKYTIRKTIKTAALGWSYGMGAQKLAQRAKMSLGDAKKLKFDLEYSIFPTSTRWKQLAQRRLLSCRGYGLPDGIIIRSKGRPGERMKNATSIGNFPIQGMGAVILRQLVREIAENIPKAELLATIHDAVFFMVDEGDMLTIEQVSKTMKDVANRCLGVPEGQDGMKVGEPDIIKHGEIWVPEGYMDEAIELLKLGGYEP